ncbi:hypothetical protein AAEH73_10190 [Shewanella algae]|uniref:hypothetical protein n=1 Tax=Shewanella algae TaxID=38313 RepID=UPI00313B63E6
MTTPADVPDTLESRSNSSPSKKVIAGVGGLSSILIALTKSEYWELTEEVQGIIILLIPAIVSLLAVIFEWVISYLGVSSAEEAALTSRIKKDLKDNKKAMKDPLLSDPDTQKRLKAQREALYEKLSSRSSEKVRRV